MVTSTCAWFPHFFAVLGHSEPLFYQVHSKIVYILRGVLATTSPWSAAGGQFGARQALLRPGVSPA